VSEKVEWEMVEEALCIVIHILMTCGSYYKHHNKFYPTPLNNKTPGKLTLKMTLAQKIRFIIDKVFE
jgi:hypothetical protein